MNPTISNFGYPETLLKEYQHWVVLLRPKQPTIGSLILAEKSLATEARQIQSDAYTELHSVKKDIERVLREGLNAQKINYLMLMMVDPNVHYHVIPRYENPQKFNSQEYLDTGWPKLPDLAHDCDLSPGDFDSLRLKLVNLF